MFQSSLDEVLHEVDDLDQEPGEDEIREYADLIGIDADSEPDLLWIARAGITAPLPADWKPIQVNNGDELYFYNFKTGESSWEHPSDEKYRQLVIEERNKKSSQQKSKTGSVPTKPPPAKGPPKQLSASNSAAAAAATAALKPLKQPPPSSGGVGKLAPIGGQQTNSVTGPPGKLQPLNAGPPAASTLAPPRAAGKTLTPISATTGNELERPKTSRGSAEKEKAPEPQPSPQAQRPTAAAVLGGGSRFLKKNEENAATDVSQAKNSNIVQNVLRFPSEESDLESESSLESESVEVPGVKKESVVSQNLVLDLDELKPAGVLTPSPAPVNKPPAAPKTANQAPPTASMPAKEQIKPEPPKPVIVSAPEKPKVLPAPTIVNETATPTKSASDALADVEKVEKQLQEDYERRVKQLREQHDSKLKDVRSKFEDEEKKETEKIKRGMDDRLRSLKEKLQKDEDAETKSLTVAHKKRTDELRSKLEQERVDTEKELRSKFQIELGEIEKEISKRNTDEVKDDGAANFARERKRLEDENKKALETLKNNLEKTLIEEERRSEGERKRKTDELRERLQKELDEWYRKEKERKTAMLKIDIDKELAEAKTNLESQKRSALEDEVTKELELRRRDIEEQRERQLAEIRRDHEAELNRMRRKNKDMFDEEIATQQRQNDRIRDETFGDLREKQEDALKTAELQLKSFRDELSALTRMTADIRQSLQPTAAENNLNRSHGSVVENGKHSSVGENVTAKRSRKERHKIDPAKAAVVKSIGDLLLPEADGSRSSRSATSSIGQKLEGLESDDVLDKVTRFLESQKAVGAHLNKRTSAQKDDGGLASGSTPPFNLATTTRSVNGGSLINLQSNLNALLDRVQPPQRSDNVFRIQSKDAVDDYLDRKVKEYFRGKTTFSNARDRSQWMPSASASNFQQGYYNNRRRGFDVDSELNSLKRWLNDFENRVSNKTSNFGQRPRSSSSRMGGERNGLLPIESNGHTGADRANNVISFLNEEESVEI